MIYLDNNATTKFSIGVQKYLSENFVDEWGNASSEHLFGQNFKEIIKDDREFISNFLGVSRKNILFTSGATESINSILNPIFFNESKITAVISSKLEHQATLSSLERLKKNGVKVLWVENDKNGIIYQEDLEKLVKENPRSLVSFLPVNNETGVVQSVKQLTEICKEYGCLVHIDSVQMLGKQDFDLFSLGVDFASFSAHKIGGLKGTGLLYMKTPESFVPLIVGGGQEEDLRGGTYNINGIRSFRLAIEDAKDWDIDKITNIRDNFEKDVLSIDENIIVNCQNSHRVGNTSSVYFPNVPNKVMLIELSRKEICVSTGSACSSGTTDPSHVIQGLGRTKDYAFSCIRFSFAHFNTYDEASQSVEILKKIICR